MGVDGDGSVDLDAVAGHGDITGSGGDVAGDRGGGGAARGDGDVGRVGGGGGVNRVGDGDRAHGAAGIEVNAVEPAIAAGADGDGGIVGGAPEDDLAEAFLDEGEFSVTDLEGSSPAVDTDGGVIVVVGEGQGAGSHLGDVASDRDVIGGEGEIAWIPSGRHHALDIDLGERLDGGGSHGGDSGECRRSLAVGLGQSVCDGDRVVETDVVGVLDGDGSGVLTRAAANFTGEGDVAGIPGIEGKGSVRVARRIVGNGGTEGDPARTGGGVDVGGAAQDGVADDLHGAIVVAVGGGDVAGKSDAAVGSKLDQVDSPGSSVTDGADGDGARAGVDVNIFNGGPINAGDVDVAGTGIDVEVGAVGKSDRTILHGHGGSGGELHEAASVQCEGAAAGVETDAVRVIRGTREGDARGRIGVQGEAAGAVGDITAKGDRAVACGDNDGLAEGYVVVDGNIPGGGADSAIEGDARRAGERYGAGADDSAADGDVGDCDRLAGPSRDRDIASTQADRASGIGGAGGRDGESAHSVVGDGLARRECEVIMRGEGEAVAAVPRDVVVHSNVASLCSRGSRLNFQAACPVEEVDDVIGVDGGARFWSGADGAHGGACGDGDVGGVDKQHSGMTGFGADIDIPVHRERAVAGDFDEAAVAAGPSGGDGSGRSRVITDEGDGPATDTVRLERSGVHDRAAFGLDDEATVFEDEFGFGADLAAVVDGDGVDVSAGGLDLGGGGLDDALVVDADFALFAGRIFDDDADAFVARLTEFNLVAGGESGGPVFGGDISAVFDGVSEEENIASESIDLTEVFDARF